MNNVFLTIHDLKAFEPKAQRGKGKKEIYRVFSKKARHIIAVSHYTKQQIVTLCGVDPEKVSVIENGISKERLEHIQKYEPSAHYDFVYVSSFAKHKMHKLLVESLPKGASLLAIGRDFGELNFVHETIKSRSGEIEVSIRTDVEDDGELFSLLKSAKVGVFPSIYEGFGIPLLEYKAAGLFVNASDILPFQELSTFVDSFHQQGNKESLEYSLIHSLKKYQTAKKVDKELERFNEVHLADKLTVCLGISVGKVK